MEFRILGPLEVLDDGRALELGGARQRALLAILLLHRGEIVSADRLIDELYGGAVPATAAKSLQAHVSRLRRALGGDGRVQTRPRGYVLALEGDEVDADRFVELLNEGRRALERGEREAAAESLAAALALWRGPPLADLAYEPFAQFGDHAPRGTPACRARGAGSRLTLRSADMPSSSASSSPSSAEHPLRERLRAQLMLGLYRSRTAGRGSRCVPVGADACSSTSWALSRARRYRSSRARCSEARSRARSRHRGGRP